MYCDVLVNEDKVLVTCSITCAVGDHTTEEGRPTSLMTYLMCWKVSCPSRRAGEGRQGSDFHCGEGVYVGRAGTQEGDQGGREGACVPVCGGEGTKQQEENAAVYCLW